MKGKKIDTQMLGKKKQAEAEWHRHSEKRSQTPHAHLVLKGVYVEVIELAVVGVSLRTYACVNCTQTGIRQRK